MNELKLERSLTLIDLAAALEKSVEAAVALGISEKEVISQVTERMHSKGANNVVHLPVEEERKMYNPEAGP